MARLSLSLARRLDNRVSLSSALSDARRLLLRALSPANRRSLASALSEPRRFLVDCLLAVSSSPTSETVVSTSILKCDAVHGGADLRCFYMRARTNDRPIAHAHWTIVVELELRYVSEPT